MSRFGWSKYRRATECGPRRPKSVTGYLCLCSTRLRGAQRNCGHLWACAMIQYRQPPSVPSISTTCFCIPCLEEPIIPSCVVLGVPLRQAALHKHSAYVILPGTSWYKLLVHQSGNIVPSHGSISCQVQRALSCLGFN